MNVYCHPVALYIWTDRYSKTPIIPNLDLFFAEKGQIIDLKC